jgi:uncharacterized protein (TIGR03067 family)
VPATLLASTVGAAGALSAEKALAAGAISSDVADLTYAVLHGLALTKWKIVIAAFMAVALAGTGTLLVIRSLPRAQRNATAPDAPAANTGRAESDAAHQELQGTWVVVSGQRHERAMTPEELRNWGRLVFAGDTVAREGAEPKRGTYSIQPDRRPREIDLFTDGDPWKGIYKIEKGRLKLALTVRGDRPTDFAARDGQLLVLEKQ